MSNKEEKKESVRKTVKQQIKKDLESAGPLVGKTRGETQPIKKGYGVGPQIRKSDSKYLAAILDPVNAGYGAKIPDTITIPSFPFQATTRLAIAPVQDAGATNPYGYVMAVIYTFGCPQISGATSNFWVLTAFNSVANTLAWTLQPTTARSWAANLIAQAVGARLVSGVAMLQGQSNYQQAGKLCSAFVPPIQAGNLTIPFSAPGTGKDATSLIENLTYSNTIAEKTGFARSLYIPQDNNTLIYSSPSAVSPSGYGMAMFAASGMLAPATAGGTHELIVVENFECIAINSSASLITSTPSKTDPFEMAVAANAVAESPHIATAVTPKEVATSGAETASMVNSKGGTVVHAFDPESQERTPSIMEKMMGGFGAVSKTVKDVAPYVAPLLALL